MFAGPRLVRGTLGAMTVTYKLLFRGEVLEGQHPAVVRKRLGTLASFGSEHLDLLFSGRPVVVKRDADVATAARLQALFKQAGARLRVAEAAEAVAEVAEAVAEAAEDGSPAGRDKVQPALELLPSGSPVLSDDERRRWLPRDVDTSRLSLAEAGTRLGVASVVPATDRTVPSFDLAPVGVRLGEPRPPSSAPAPDTSHLQIE
jgi:hypothetical protein